MLTCIFCGILNVSYNVARLVLHNTIVCILDLLIFYVTTSERLAANAAQAKQAEKMKRAAEKKDAAAGCRPLDVGSVVQV